MHPETQMLLVKAHQADLKAEARRARLAREARATDGEHGRLAGPSLRLRAAAVAAVAVLVLTRGIDSLGR